MANYSSVREARKATRFLATTAVFSARQAKPQPLFKGWAATEMGTVLCCDLFFVVVGVAQQLLPAETPLLLHHFEHAPPSEEATGAPADTPPPPATSGPGGALSPPAGNGTLEEGRVTAHRAIYSKTFKTVQVRAFLSIIEEDKSSLVRCHILPFDHGCRLRMALTVFMNRRLLPAYFPGGIPTIYTLPSRRRGGVTRPRVPSTAMPITWPS